MSDLIQEVANDIKTEKFFNVIGKFTKIFLAIALIVILLSIAFVYKDYKYEQKQLSFSVDYYRMINMNATAVDYKNLNNALTQSYSEAYRAMASLAYARVLFAEKKYQDALELLAIIANDRINDITFKNIAKIMLMSTVLTQEMKDYNIDSGIGKTHANEPFHGTIKLLYAQILLRNNQNAEAKKILAELIQANNTLENINFLGSVLMNNINN